MSDLFSKFDEIIALRANLLASGQEDPFSLVNASAGLQYRHLELSIWAKNIGDARYLAFSYATQTSATSPVLLGMPRTYGITVKTRF